MKEDRLSEYLQRRPASLLAAKERGQKVVGYFPGGYVPEEIIYAAGAVPVCLCQGGSYRAAEAALSTVPGVICPFARAQIGEMAARTNLYYGMVDLVVAPITCQHLKEVAETWEYRGEVEIFKLGIPHQRGEMEREYFTDRLRLLGERLGKFTGKAITDAGLEEAIALYDRMSLLLAEIGLMRRDPLSPLTTKDFATLNHASFYADPGFMVEELERIREELRTGLSIEPSSRPRFLLAGPSLVPGDTAILDLVDAAGGDVVVEEFFEGMRSRRQPAAGGGDPFSRLARSYLQGRLPPAFMRSSTGQRLDFILKLVEDFNISGVIWYELLCCETYDQESYFLFRKLSEKGIPMLIVESDYSPLDTGALRTRLGAFVELAQGGPING